MTTEPAEATPPPHNLECEQALLGAILVNNEAFHRCAAVVDADDFFEPVHGDIFAAISGIIADNRTATPITVKALLPAELLEHMTMPQYLARLAGGATTVLNARDFAYEIKRTAMWRRLGTVAAELGEDSKQGFGSPNRAIDDLQSALFEMAEQGSGRRHVHGFDHSSRAAIEMAAAAYKRDGGLSGTATGLIDLDRMMGGMQRSDFIILAARPSMGKTALATNIAFKVANSFVANTDDESQEPEKGGRVLFFSLEMSGEQLSTRILSEQAGVPSTDIRRGNIQETQFNRLSDTATRLRHIPLYIDDNGGSNIAQLAATARRLKRLKNIDLIVVDYLQLLSGVERRKDGRVQELSEITGKLKALAKELDVPVLALSQLSRQVENREDKRPQLSDLRESGSIEQDADVVMFLYREAYYLERKEPQDGTADHLEWQHKMEAVNGKAELILGKQRHGPTGKVDLAFEGQFTRFSNLAGQQFLPEVMR